VERVGVAGLARELGYSERHLRRQVVAELGVGPLELARAQRAQAARILLETTGRPVTEVAFAAGFGSLRQFNDTIRAVFALTPTELRRRATPPDGAGDLVLRLAYRPPLDGDALLRWLAARAVPGIEEVTDGTYRRSLRLPHGAGTAELSFGERWVTCRLRLDDLRDVTPAVQRCRRALDLDADPEAVAAFLSGDRVLAPLVRRAPGLRVPGTVDGTELAVRAVLGQQVSLAAARTLAGRLVRDHGEALANPRGAVRAVFPAADAIGAAELAIPRARADAVRAVAGLRLDAGADRERARRELLAIRGVGEWTAGYVAMRALGDPDVFLAGDLGVRHALRALGGPVDPAAWSPWRSYATQHLWASLAHASPAVAAAAA
jgi:AraC family transcriptional regulator of adaptative response / DNA-3-methyladenine glycosylase II